jgi:hypothetical protein
LRLPRLLAPARIIVFTLLGSFALSLAAASSLARMTSGFAEMEKPLRNGKASKKWKSL